MKFYQSIRWSHKINKRLVEVRKTLPKEYIGIHYREYKEAGDGADANNPNSSIKVFNPARFSDNSPLTSFAEMIQYSNCSFLFISNNPQSLGDLKKLAPVQANYIKTVPKQSSDRTTTQGILDAVIDFILLSESKLIIGSFYSSFSDEASNFHLVPKICPLNKDLVEVVRKNGASNYHCYNFNELNVMKESYFGLHLNLHTISKYMLGNLDTLDNSD